MCAITEDCLADAVEDTRARGGRFDITNMLKKTLLGLEAQPEFQRQLRESYEPIGKLIRPLRREEIAERNGEYGKPLWIILGQNVFDITGTWSLNTSMHTPRCLDC